MSSCDQIKAVAAVVGLEIAATASLEHFVDNKNLEFFSKFPHGKIPAFEGADDFKGVKGAAIARRSQSLERRDGIVTQYRFYFEI